MFKLELNACIYGLLWSTKWCSILQSFVNCFLNLDVTVNSFSLDYDQLPFELKIILYTLTRLIPWGNCWIKTTNFIIEWFNLLILHHVSQYQPLLQRTPILTLKDLPLIEISAIRKFKLYLCFLFDSCLTNLSGHIIKNTSLG